MNLRDARRDRGLTLTELAEHVEVSVSSLSLYERGVVEPGPKTAARIARFFGVRQSEFWPTEQEAA